MSSQTPNNFFPTCPEPGAGVHHWILKAAHHCKKIGLFDQDAGFLIRKHMTRPSKGREIEDAIEKAYQSKSTGSLLASIKEQGLA